MKDWYRILYVDNARVYQPVLEAGLASAPSEAKGLAKILEQHEFGTHGGRRPKVLDVSCGIGRHAINLAKLGYEVVGYDFSPYFLRTARKLARQEGLDNDAVRFYEGDNSRIRELLEPEGEMSFDAIISMDTSLVRPTLREENELLRSMHGLGHAGSLLVIETANREHFLKHRIPLPIVQTFSKGRLQRHIQATYDAQRKQIKGEWRFYRRLANRDLHHLLSVKVESNIHSETDLRKLLERAGWEHLQTYGSVRRLDKLSSNSFHIVMVAMRPR